MSFAKYFVRSFFELSDRFRDFGLTIPEDIVIYENISYGDDKKYQILDIYSPKNNKGYPIPIIVCVHGGGWVYGDKDKYRFYCTKLSQYGFAVINFSYRLSSKFKFPSQIEDINLVFNWIFKFAKEYNLDTNNIFAVGDSVGANMLSLYVGLCKNKNSYNLNLTIPSNLNIKAIALNCGIYKIDNSKKTYIWIRWLLKDYLNANYTLNDLEKISSVNYIGEDYPPTYIMSCFGDFFLPQAKILKNVLSQNNIPFVYKIYGSPKNRLYHVFNLNIKLSLANICNYNECEFFKKYLQN